MPPTPCWKSGGEERGGGRGAAWNGCCRCRSSKSKGDWAAARPDMRPGGWAFQYRNAHYPDLDDTAVVVMAMDRARRDMRGAGDRYDEAIARGVEWIAGLQSRNGGWAAFDADNDRSLSQQHSLRRSRRAARPADRRCQRALRQHAGPARRDAGEPAHARPARAISSASRRRTAAGSAAGA